MLVDRELLQLGPKPLERRLAGKLVDEAPSALVTTASRPNGAQPCETTVSRNAGDRHPDRAAVMHFAVEDQRLLARPLAADREARRQPAAPAGGR